MTGLEKMVSQIIDEAGELATQKIEAAKVDAQAITEEASKAAAATKKEYSEKAQVDVTNYMDRVKSSADLQRRTSILKAKQEVIADVLDKAYESLLQKSDEEYFAIIRLMLQKFVAKQKGEIYFSAKDLARMPKGLEEEIQGIAAEKGGELILAKTTKEIESGFVLVYGGIEENCTFKALFDTNKDRLQDQAHKELFA